MVASDAHSCSVDAAAPSDRVSSSSTAKEKHLSSKRAAKRRALAKRLEKCEDRAEQHDEGLEVFIAGLDLEKWYSAVLQHTISVVTARQRSDGRDYKSPEKESRLILRKVRLQITDMMQQLQNVEQENDFDENAVLAAILDENALAESLEASVKRHLVEEEIELKWFSNQERKPITDLTTDLLTATQKRQLMEKRIEMRLEMYCEDSSAQPEPEQKVQNTFVDRSKSTLAAPSPYGEILGTIEQIEKLGVPRHDRAAWLEFKGIMRTINEIQTIGNRQGTDPSSSYGSPYSSRSIFAVDI